MAVSKRLRFEILRRDNHTCRYCGGHAPDVALQVDHVIPTTLGGLDVPENLVAACKDCNAGKSSVPAGASLVNDVQADALRWANALRLAAAAAYREVEMREQYQDYFEDLWRGYMWGPEGNRQMVPLPDDWTVSLDRFNAAGLPAWMWDDIVKIAMSNNKVSAVDTFRYACGTAWNKVTDLQEAARDIVRADEQSGGVR